MRSTFAILDSTGSSGPELISLAALKSALGITGTTDDAELTASILRWSKLIAEWCGRRFGFAEASETFTFAVGEVLLPRQALTLRLYPVEEVFSISIGGIASTPATLAVQSGWGFDGQTGLIWLDGSWQGEVSIEYSGGYQLPDDAPATLQEAVIQAIREDRAGGGVSSDAVAGGVREVAHGDTRVSFFSSEIASASSVGVFSSTVFDLIRPFKRPAFA